MNKRNSPASGKMTQLKEVLSVMYKEGMIAYMKEQPGEYEEAVRLAVSNDQPYSWRAAWLLWSCMEENDPRLKKHTAKFIKALDGKKDGHQREIIKILMKMDLTERQESLLFDKCVSLWEQTALSPSIRYTAFHFIRRIASKYPELKKEISALFQPHFITPLSPGAKNGINRMLKEDGFFRDNTE